jgi:hypothetical protein
MLNVPELLEEYAAQQLPGRETAARNELLRILLRSIIAPADPRPRACSAFRRVAPLI